MNMQIFKKVYTKTIRHKKKKNPTQLITDTLNVCKFSLSHMRLQPEAEQAQLCTPVIY